MVNFAGKLRNFFLMKDIQKTGEFNPNGIGLKNGNFIGLPFTRETAKVVFVPVPWDVTVSYGEGTAHAPQAILDASSQLDLFDPDVEDAWKLGIYMLPAEKGTMAERDKLRPAAKKYIDFLEEGGDISNNQEMKTALDAINTGCEKLNQKVYKLTKELLEENKLPVIVGGDHSVPLGYLKALSGTYPDFGILQIDAHHDLRNSYEGFLYSHASIFYNALKIKEISKLVQVGVRDYCQEEVEKAASEKERISVFYDHLLKENKYLGMNWGQQCDKIIAELPAQVYLSVDIDGLDPKLCPNTGTPVPGGLDYDEVIFLAKKIVASGRQIIGFDLCETGSNEWDANIGARLLYKLSNLMGKSQGKI